MEKVTYWLFLVFPIVLLAVKPIAMIIFALLGIIGIFIAIKEKINPFKEDSIKLFSYLTVGYFMVMSFSVLMSNEPLNSWVHLSRISHFLVAPFIALAILQVHISIKQVTLGFKIGLIIAGLITLVDFSLSHGGGSFSGMYNPNTFGDLAVLLLLFAMINIENENLTIFMFTLVGITFGITAVILSSSRGAILSLIFLLVVYFILMYSKNRKNSQKLLFTILFSFLLIGFNGFVLNKAAANRILFIQKEAKQWEGGKGNIRNTTGTRLEMYKSGWNAFLDSPIIGYGYHNCGIAAARYASQEKWVQEDFIGRWHLHNEWITTMVNAGVLGVLALLVLYTVPFLLFLQNVQKNIYGTLGVLLIIGYIVLGMTHTLFGYEYETAFFVVMLAWLCIEIKRKGIIRV